MTRQKEKPFDKKTFFSFIFVILMTILLVWIFTRGVDIEQLKSLLIKVNRRSIIYAGICFILYFLLCPLSLHILAKQNDFETRFHDNFLIGSSEHFFCNITPFCSGGQPMLVYLFNQKKIHPKRSIGVIIANFIALMIATNLFSVSSLLFFEDFTTHFNTLTLWVIGLGFFFNLMMLFFLLFFAPSEIVRRGLNKLLSKLSNLKLLGRFIYKHKDAVDDYCKNIQEGLRNIFAHKLSFTCAVLLRICSLLFYYSIPYFLLHALGVPLETFMLPYIILATSFAITAMVWLPMPGGTGGIEFAFITIFASFSGVTKEISIAQTFLWRMLTYYSLIMLGFICYLSFEIILRKRYEKKEEVRMNLLLEAADEITIEDEYENNTNTDCEKNLKK